MKIIFTSLSILFGIITNAQVLGYSDFGVLLSNENNMGTARSMGLKESFGALGGDLSAIAINPAGAAIFTSSTGSFTIAYNTLNLDSDFYGTKTNNTTDSFNLSQAGGVLVFDGDDEEGLNKISLSLNYQISNYFKNNWMASGISEPTWVEDPIDSSITYTILENQTYKNFTTGKHDKLNFAIAAQFNNNLYLGISLNSYDTDFLEKI